MSNYYDYWSPKGSSYGKWMLQHVDQIWYRNDQTIRDQPSCFYILNCDTTSYVDTSRTLRRNSTLRTAYDQFCWKWWAKCVRLEPRPKCRTSSSKLLRNYESWVIQKVSIGHALDEWGRTVTPRAEQKFQNKLWILQYMLWRSDLIT